MWPGLFLSPSYGERKQGKKSGENCPRSFDFLRKTFQSGGGPQRGHVVEGSGDACPEEGKTQKGMSHGPWGIAGAHGRKLKRGTL